MRNQLRQARLNKELTRKDVAEAVGITESYYGMIEQGVRQPALDVAASIAILLGDSVDALFLRDRTTPDCSSAA